MCIEKVVPTKISTLSSGDMKKTYIITSEIFISLKILKLSHCMNEGCFQSVSSSGKYPYTRVIQ